MNNQSALRVTANNEEPRPSLVWQLVAKLDEERQFPRVPVAIEVMIRNFRGASVTTQAMNLSPDGLQLRCDVATAQVIHVNGGHVRSGRDPLLDITMRLPLATGDEVVATPCELLYVTNVDAEPRVVLGLRFVRLARESERTLSIFLGEQLGNPGTRTLS